MALALGGCLSRAPKGEREGQEACIEALRPFTQGDTPSPDGLAAALDKAGTAAAADPGQWQPVRARMEELALALNRGGDVRPAVDGLLEACRRANDRIKRRLGER